MFGFNSTNKIMNKWTKDILLPEQKPNSEPQPIDTTLSHPIGY